MKKVLFLLVIILPLLAAGQVSWRKVDSLFQPLPASVHVFHTSDSLDGKPNIAYYLEARLDDKQLDFTSAVGNGKRFTPQQYFQAENNPLLVVNCTFFEFTHNSNLNVVVKDGKLVAFNGPSIAGRGKDTFTYRHVFASAIGINKKRQPDVAWLYTDSSLKHPYAVQQPVASIRDSVRAHSLKETRRLLNNKAVLKKWKVRTAVGGGPVLVQNGDVLITNNEEAKFGGKAINDKHPRTAMGYTADGRFIVMVVQGRMAGIADGASLTQLATLLKNVGCVEALNLDGGGSSCMLVNGKETIKPSDKGGQRPVPAVFMISKN